ncbi:MAG: M14 family zinc carboxypeptidase [Thermoanaerobaculia bacterium]
MKKTFVAALLVASGLFAQEQPDDQAYTEAIRRNTTGEKFITELVDHLPASDTVPTPLKFHGYIAGQEGRLTYAEDVYRYMRALDEASPRVQVFSIGKSEEGREMILVAIANEETIANLDRYRDITRRLSDPRKLSDEEAQTLIASGKPIYYATGAMHSTETGSPEMLMELAYRLAVEETPMIRGIRDNIITLFTPVIEVDGRNRMVEMWRYREKNRGVPTPPLVYWGHHVAHDNNRDNIGLALNLSNNVMKVYFDFHPQVVHDLHESIPFLYISTGTGPYNPALDPLMIDEWHRMAYNEVNELTRRGLPGVWTHGFYDGWAPNYMFWIGMGHNSIGRFYETFGNRWPTTEDRVVRAASERQWFRPNPPLPKVRWSLRNNVNFQQSGLLLALADMSKNRARFLENFWTFSKRSVAKPLNEGPAAYVFPADQKRAGNLRDLISVLQKHGVEVHATQQPLTIDPAWPPAKPADATKSDEKTKDEKAKDAKPKSPNVTFARGSFVVRMDQPYSRLADTLLDVQYVRGDDRVYDDTGWTLGYLKNVDFTRVANADVLKTPMTLLGAPPAAPQTPLASDVEHARKFFADPATRKPRIAVLHSWLRTQDEGWYRLALESLGVPYDYISTQDVASMPNVREKYDVVIFPPVGASPMSGDIVNGMAPGPALPWKTTPLTPNLGGLDETDDMRPGLGLSGVQHLTRFVEEGGLLITVQDTAEWAIDYGLVRWVRAIPPGKLKAPGTIVRGKVTDAKSPVTAGYEETLPLFFSDSPIFRVGVREEQRSQSRPSGRGGANDPDVPQGRPFVPLPERDKPAPGEEGFQMPEDAAYNFEPYMPRAEDRPRVLVSFHDKADQLLMSGMLEGGEELAGKPAVVLAPRGRGNVLLFAVNPMWRMNTQGMYPLVMNAVINWDKLR